MSFFGIGRRYYRPFRRPQWVNRVGRYRFMNKISGGSDRHFKNVSRHANRRLILGY